MGLTNIGKTLYGATRRGRREAKKRSKLEEAASTLELLKTNFGEDIKEGSALDQFFQRAEERLGEGESVDILESLKTLATFKDVVTSETPEEEREAELEQKKAETEIQMGKEVEAARLKRKQQTKENVARANLMLLRTQENYANMVRREKEINPGFKPGRVGGLELMVSGLTGINEYVRPFEGDLVTTAISLAKIAAPSSRPGPEFERLFERTLTSIFSKPFESTQQLVQSMADAFERQMATSPGDFLSPEQLELAPQEQLKVMRGIATKFKEDMREVLNSIFEGREVTLSEQGTSKSKTKVERAQELAKENPNLTKKQIIDMVNEEYK